MALCVRCSPVRRIEGCPGMASGTLCSSLNSESCRGNAWWKPGIRVIHERRNAGRGQIHAEVREPSSDPDLLLRQITKWVRRRRGESLLKPIISSVFPRDVFTTTCRLDIFWVRKKSNHSVLACVAIRSAQISPWNCRIVVFFFVSESYSYFFIFGFWCKIICFCKWSPLKNMQKEENMFNWCEPSLCLQIACESTWAGLFRSCCLFHCSGC